MTMTYDYDILNTSLLTNSAHTLVTGQFD